MATDSESLSMTAQDWVLIITSAVSMIGASGTALWKLLSDSFRQKYESIIQKLQIEVSECLTDRKQLNLRVAGLEAIVNKSGLPMWTKDEGAVILSVSPMFVQMVGSLYGLSARDFLGKKFSDIPQLPKSFVTVVEDMLRDLSSRTTSVRCSIPVTSDRMATIIKCCSANPTTGELIYTGCVAFH